MATDSKRDPLAIIIAVVGLAVQLGLGFYWSGKLESRVTSVETRLDKADAFHSAVASHVSEQDVKIAVSVSQQADIITRLTRIEDKLGQRQ